MEKDSWQLLQHEPWLTFEPCTLDKGYLGRISNNIFNPQQPADDQRYQVFIDGEFASRRELWQKLNRSTKQIPATDHRLILELLQNGRKVEEILQAADGGFFLCVLDRKQRVIQFGNDRFGLRPHYYSQNGSRFVLGPQLKFCLACGWVTDKLDMLSAAEYFNFQLILDDRTFFSDVQLFPSGAIGSFNLDSAVFSWHKYWQPEDWIREPYSGSFEDAARETASLFKDIVAEMTADNRRYGIYLSGGLDSRQILAALPDGGAGIHTYTFGQPGCRDQVYAARMAEIAGTHHHRVLFENGHWLQELAEKHTTLTESFHCLWHAHNLNNVQQVRKDCDVNLSGHFGDVLLGGSVLKDCEPGFLFRRRLAKTYVEHYGISYPLRGEFHDSWANRMPSEEELFSSLYRYTELHDSLAPSMASDFMALEFRARKMIEYYLVHNRPYFEARTPFLNTQLVQLLYSFPSGFRKNRRLQIAVLDLLDRRQSAVPWDVTNVPPTRKRWPLFWRKKIKKFDRIVAKVTGKPLFSPSIRMYCDYENWIADDLQDWIRSVLLQPNALVADLFKAGYVDTVVQNHIDGSDRSYASTYKIGTMLSYELMLQQMKRIKALKKGGVS